MQRVILTVSLLLLAFLPASCWNGGDIPGAGVTGSTIGPVEIDIRTRGAVPLSREIYGFNTTMMGGDYAYDDRDFMALSATLKPVIMRFPGGSDSNFYHWRESGFRRSELAISYGENLNRRNLNNFARLRRRRGGVMPFDDFMDYCRKYGIKPLIVVNLYTGTPEESAAWVRYARTKGYEVYGWELGNEPYLPFYRNRFPNVRTYLAEAKRHAKLMREADPGIRLAVPANPGVFHNGWWSYGALWNKALAGENFYDAYTVHTYIKLKEHFDVGYRDDPEAFKAGLFALTDRSLSRAVDGFRRLFGDREMWVTEWNIMKPLDEPFNVADTLLHAMYCGDFFLEMVERQDVIKVSNYHTIAGPWNGFPVFSPVYFNREPSGRSIKRSCFMSFNIIGDVFAASSLFYPLALKNNVSHRDVTPPLRAVAVGGGGVVFVLVSNRSGAEVPVRFSMDGSRRRGPFPYRFLGGERLTLRARKGEMEVRAIELSSEAVIPPNSFGVVELRPASMAR